MDAVLNWVWQGGVVMLSLSLLLLALERARANVRYVVCWAASLFIMALPALPFLQSTADSRDTFGATQGDAIVSLPDAWWTSTLVMLAAWLLWASIHIVRFVSATVAIRRARARSRAFPSHVESVLPHWRRVRSDGRRATLVLSDSVTTAAVLGWGVPLIAVAPSLVRTLDAEELDRVLIHEWAHVQRRDDLVNVLQIVVRMMAGWHPALWWIDRRLHVEREIACDEITVAITGSLKSYAECLMKLASVRGTLQAMWTAPAVLTPSGLRTRVSRLMSPYAPIAPAWSRSIAAAIVTMLFLMCAGLSELKLVEPTAFALPLVSPRTFSASSVARVPTLPVGIETERSPHRTVGRAPSAQRQEAKQPSSPQQPTIEPDAPPTTDAAPPMDLTPAAPAAAGRAREEEVANVPHISPQPSGVSAEQPQTPWMAAAAGGAALGRKSKDAGVATAGFFTRVARRVAGSF